MRLRMSHELVVDMISDEIMKDIYRKLISRIESIDNTLIEINTTLQNFGSYMPMPEEADKPAVRNDVIE